jgi:hypothetical protein
MELFSANTETKYLFDARGWMRSISRAHRKRMYIAYDQEIKFERGEIILRNKEGKVQKPMFAHMLTAWEKGFEMLKEVMTELGELKNEVR